MNEQEFWATVRRGLAMVMGAIEQRYNIDPRCPECRSRRRRERQAAEYIKQEAGHA